MSRKEFRIEDINVEVGMDEKPVIHREAVLNKNFASVAKDKTFLCILEMFTPCDKHCSCDDETYEHSGCSSVSCNQHCGDDTYVPGCDYHDGFSWCEVNE